MKINVLIIGAAGREDALAWKIAASPLAGKVLCAPGNAGIAQYAQCVPASIDDHASLIKLCGEEKIGLVIIGPEAALMAGLADILRARGMKVFGPSAAAARLEGSKSFTRELCAAYDIPSPAWRVFHSSGAGAAKTFIAGQPFPLVVKADGLAAGKGVVIAENQQQAQRAIDDIFDGKFGGGPVLIEEFMQGEEASFFALSDGRTARAFGTAQDHKRAFDGDQGPNTGGMGALSPARMFSPQMEADIMNHIIHPTLAAMQEKGTPFSGVLYAGLMMTPQGAKLVEFNVRFGDPECQVLMLRLKSDLLELLWAVAENRLDKQEILWHDDHAVTVVMASQGYPASYQTGSVIGGIDAASALDQVRIFHAATLCEKGVWRAQGGRVLNVSAWGKNLEEARRKAYAAVNKIDWPDGFFRSDIGLK